MRAWHTRPEFLLVILTTIWYIRAKPAKSVGSGCAEGSDRSQGGPRDHREQHSDNQLSQYGVPNSVMPSSDLEYPKPSYDQRLLQRNMWRGSADQALERGNASPAACYSSLLGSPRHGRTLFN